MTAIRMTLTCLALCLLNLGFQLLWHAGALDNQIVSARHPASADAREYARVASTLAGSSGVAEDDAVPAATAIASPRPPFSHRFDAAFEDGWRMPGYPLFLAAFQGAAEPWRAARLAQIALTVPIGAVFFLTLWLLTAPRREGVRVDLSPALAPAVAGGALAALWPPLYHYSPALLAEAPALFLMALLLLTLAACYRLTASIPRPGGAAFGNVGIETVLAGLAGVLVAALTYLKPNHLLLLGPVMLILFLNKGLRDPSGAVDTARVATGRGSSWRTPWSPFRKQLLAPLTAAVVTTALLAPWSLYVSQRQGTFVPLTLNAGYNLLLGTGRIPNGDPAALPYRAAQALKIQSTQAPEGDVDNVEGLSTESSGAAITRAEAWSAAGQRLWAEHPVALSLHGVAKVLHAFGFSLRGARDALLALFTGASALAGWCLWRRRRYRAWIVFTAGCALAVALQAFLYLPNQRFKTVLFDPAALVLIALALPLATPGGRKRNLPGEA